VTTRSSLADLLADPGSSARNTTRNSRLSGSTIATLPIGSIVQVTNPETGRSVKVQINDRGPYVRGRGLDLSQAAAREIGLTRKGVARVKVTALPAHFWYRTRFSG
jgi:rare lipoprotein A